LDTPSVKTKVPVHYSQYKFQPVEVIDDWQLDFQLGNVLKYIARHRFKGGIEDLKKAAHYLEMEIQKLTRSDARKEGN
jgi:hypothetical protein